MAFSSNKAAVKQHDYDLKVWDTNYSNYVKDIEWQWNKNKGDRTFLEEAGRFTDATARQKWLNAVQLQNHQFKGQVAAFNRSEENFEKQMAYNNISAAQAYQAERVKFEELQAEVAFDRQDEMITALQSEGEARAAGISGRSAGKAVQSSLAQKGRNIAILSKGLENANKAHLSAIAQIATAKEGADLNAYAKRLLKPTVPPAIPEPFKSPRAFIADPIKKAKPPRPIKGAVQSGAGFLGTLGQIAGIAASAAATYAAFTSDDRLKYDINRVGTSKSGIPKYTFKYRQDGKHGPTYLGTSAQDLIKMGREDAVVQKEKGGFYAVDYSKIDVNFEQIS